MRPGESLIDIARAYDIGYDQILAANPRLNRWVPEEGARVVIPSLYIIPPGEHRGIVLNIAELRLYFFGGERSAVHTYPVSVGDVAWNTPRGSYSIVGKERDPAWYPPKSIRAEHLAEGEELPHMIPGGAPDNPLGAFALKLSIPGYLIHGTNPGRSYGIGMRVSHGCIRLYPEDMEELFQMTRIGMPVRIIDQPIKAGWRDTELFLEIHHPLAEDESSKVIPPPTLEDVVRIVAPLLRGSNYVLSIEKLRETFEQANGIPTVIATRG